MSAGATIPAGRCSSCGHFAPIGEITRCSRCDCDRHVATPQADPQTPPGAESILQSLSQQIEAAASAVKEARNAEVEAEHAYKGALRKALLSAACPKVRTRRDDGSQVTVAERDAWAAEQVSGEELEWQIAKATRQAAVDHLHALKSQASVGQSIAASVRESYRGTGRWDS